MALTPRILDVNLFMASANVISADSYEPALPTRYLLDQLPSKVWRSRTGWTVVANWNDQYTFTVFGIGTFTATITAGTYVTGAELATALSTAFEAAYAPGTWTWTYSASTAKFQLVTDVSTSLDNSYSGTTRSIFADVGFNVGAPGPDTVFTSDNAVYHSRHYIACDFGSATAITAAILLGDNVSASGSVKVQSSATSIAAALTAPTVTQTLVDQGDLWSLYFSSQSHRYVVFLITDTTNTSGYSEAGICFLGTYRQPTVNYSGDGFVEEGDDLSLIEQATEGAHMGDLRPEAPAWQLQWDDVSDSSGDADLFRAFRTATPKGKNFFFDFDATQPDLVYGYRSSPLPLPITNRAYWSPSFTFREALP